MKKFSIFLPVRNGGCYLPQCVQSILSQSYGHFELIILDNNSNDGTVEYLSEISKTDQRIKIVFSEEYLSIEENWSRIHRLEKCEFMTIIGHDDLLDADFLDEVSKLIDDVPIAKLYQTHFRLIDANGNFIRECRPIPKVETASEFLAARLMDVRDSFGTGYVMRSSDYDDFGGISLFCKLMYADDALWIKLIGSSVKICSPKVCFSYRLHDMSTSGKQDKKSAYSALLEYSNFLDLMRINSKEIDDVLKYHADRYIERRSFDYYRDLVSHSDAEYDSELAKIKFLMNKYSSNAALKAKLDSGIFRYFEKLKCTLKKVLN